MLFLSFDKAQKYENGQDRIFSRPWRDMAPKLYIWKPSIAWIFFRMFHCFCCIFHHFSLVFTFFHYFSLLFIVFQLFNLILWALIRLKNMKTDKIKYFETLAWHCSKLIYIYIYIWKPSIAWIVFHMFHCFCCIFHILLAYQIKPTILLGKSQNIQTCFHYVLR